MIENRRKYVSELLGTYILVYFAAGSVMIAARLEALPGPLVSGIASGMALMIVIWTFGHVSGAHVNPALSLCTALLGMLPWRLLPGYMASQLLGSALAGLTLLWTLGNHGQMGANLPNPALGISPACAFVIETILSAIMMIVILMVIDIRGALKDFAAIPIGAVVGIEVMLMGPVAGAAMNPARAFGPYLVMGDWANFWIYLAGPVLGLTAATMLFRLVYVR
jgi:MIP family channel proteins